MDRYRSSALTEGEVRRLFERQVLVRDGRLDFEALSGVPRALEQLAQTIVIGLLEAPIDAVVSPEGFAHQLATHVAQCIRGRTNSAVELVGVPKSVRTATGVPVFELRRDDEHRLLGRRVLIIDDYVNTGDTIRSLIACIRSAEGATVSAVSVLARVERTPRLTAHSFGVEHFYPLHTGRYEVVGRARPVESDSGSGASTATSGTEVSPPV